MWLTLWYPSDVSLDHTGRSFFRREYCRICTEFCCRRFNRWGCSCMEVDCCCMVCAAYGVPIDCWIIEKTKKSGAQPSGNPRSHAPFLCLNIDAIYISILVLQQSTNLLINMLFIFIESIFIIWRLTIIAIN